MVKFAHYDEKTGAVLSLIDTAIIDVYEFPEYGGIVKITDAEFTQLQTAPHWTTGRIFTTTPPPTPFSRLNENGVWIEDEQEKEKATNEIRTNYIERIDNTVAAIYGRFLRFDAEYNLREAQAIEFKENKFKGDAPSQIKAFAEPSGIDAQQATEIILEQAAKLKAGLEALGVLRMQKQRLKHLQEYEAIEQAAEEILAKIQQVQEQL